MLKLKKILIIIFLSFILFNSHSYAVLCGTIGFGCPSMSGCVYDELGRKVDCVSIKFMGKTGLSHSDAERMCLNAVRRMAAERGFTHSAATGGCVY